MAVNAIALINSYDITTTQYQIFFQYTVRDGSNAVHTGSGHIDVNFGVYPSKISQLLREAIAADILSSYSLTIDPNDILVPHSLAG